MKQAHTHKVCAGERWRRHSNTSRNKMFFFLGPSHLEEKSENLFGDCSCQRFPSVGGGARRPFFQNDFQTKYEPPISSPLCFCTYIRFYWLWGRIWLAASPFNNYFCNRSGRGVLSQERQPHQERQTDFPKQFPTSLPGDKQILQHRLNPGSLIPERRPRQQKLAPGSMSQSRRSGPRRLNFTSWARSGGEPGGRGGGS